MTQDSFARARARVLELQRASSVAQAQLAGAGGHGEDEITSLSIDSLGGLVEVSFSLTQQTSPDRWAKSLLNVYRQACAGLSMSPLSTDPGALDLTPIPAQPVADRPLAPEQHRTERQLATIVHEAAEFPTRQGKLVIEGHVDGVWLSFDGALGLIAARASREAIERGPQFLAQATTAAWADANQQLTTAINRSEK